MTSVLRPDTLFFRSPNNTSNIFQDFVFTCFQPQRQCLYNYRIFKLFQGVNKAENNYSLIWYITWCNGAISAVKNNGCLPFTSKTHLVSNCANGTQKFRLENPVRSTRFPFPIRSEKTGNIS